MGDLEDRRLIYLKGFLFVVGGGLAAGLVLMEAPSWKAAALLGLAIWCFCRAYYFAFYVIERYVDPKFRFSGLLAFARYLLR